MGQQRAPLHRHTSGYDYSLSVLPRQVCFQPLSLLQISAAGSTQQQRAGLATRSFGSLGQAPPGSHEDWSCQVAKHVLSCSKQHSSHCGPSGM